MVEFDCRGYHKAGIQFFDGPPLDIPFAKIGLRDSLVPKINGAKTGA